MSILTKSLALLAAVAGAAGAAPITWQNVNDVKGDADVSSNGHIIKAYTFATGSSPVVNGVKFQPFPGESEDRQTFGSGYAQFYSNPSLSAAYNQLLTGGIYDAGSTQTAKSQSLILTGLTPGRKYQLSLWVADNRTFNNCSPAFSSSAETVHSSLSDTNIPTLRWEGGDKAPTAQTVIGTFTADKSKQTLIFTPTAGFFNGRDWFTSQLNGLVLSDLSPGTPPVPGPKAREEVPVVKTLDGCNVVWDTPSEDSFGSMPLGNGDVGANVWVEENGDLLFYVSKVDAYDSGHLLPKLGKVRVHFDPAIDTEDFKQTLVLRDAAIEIKAGDANLKFWIDANAPVIRIEGTSKTPRVAIVTIEPTRQLISSNKDKPGSGTVGIMFDDDSDRLAWCYRNESSAWGENFRSQNTPEMIAKTKDPVLHRTSGCLITGKGFGRSGSSTLKLTNKSYTIDLSVRVLSSQPQDASEWLMEASQPVKSDWAAHQAYWKEFWNRSHIYVTGCGTGKVNLDQCRFTQFPQGSKAYEGHKEIDAKLNAFQLTQRYALERFCEAAAGRGAVPQPYNGSIFNADIPAGAMSGFGVRPGPASADKRDWEPLSFMWQNTRHPYWSMLTRGDFDTLLPGMKFVRDGLDICRDHCKKLLGLDGAFIMEASWWGNVGVFNWDGMPGHLRYHQLATIETPAIMCDYYEHTRDKSFLKNILLPCADEFIAYYANRFTKRDAQGKMLMEGVGCVETYQGVTNPCTEIGGLKYVLGKLLSFDIDPARRAKWSKLLSEMPGVPTRKIRGIDLLAVGDKYDSGRAICESPEMYSIYPFRQAWLGTPSLLAKARQSFHVRTISIDGTNDEQSVETGGWQSTPSQAALLGLPREAARLASINFNDQFIYWTDNVDPNAPWQNRPHARFPAFWDAKMDYTPDNDHGANTASALQNLLLQSDGKKIYLLPAWPEDWDVSFKLCANDNTTVECLYRDGKVQSLNVTPESRKSDIVDMSSLENRIRTLVTTACADRNYLFGLPPMLDAQPKAGKTTGAWLSKHGECFAGTKAGPWPNCLFKGNTVYAFSFDGDVKLPNIPAKLVSKKYLTDKTEKPVTILKLVYDKPLDEIAISAPSQGSLTAGKTGTTIDLGKPMPFDRLEFTIENPGHKRGQGTGFELQVMDANGSWRTVHSGQVFGSIYSKRFGEVTAQNVRLNIDAPVRQFDLFPAGK